MGNLGALVALVLVAYLSIIMAHKTISVLLIMVDDGLKLLMAVFCVKRSRRRIKSCSRKRAKLAKKH